MGENEKTMSLRDAIAQGWDAAVEEAPAEVPEEAQQVPSEEAPVEQQPVQQEAPAEMPVQQTPVQEAPVQQAPSMDAQVQQLMQLIQQQQQIIGQLTQQNQQANQAMQQQSQLAEEAVNTTMEPEPYPQFDFDAVRYMDAAAQNQAMMQWQQAVVQRATKDAVEQALGQMKPIREQYEANRRIAEDDAARTAVFADSRFKDFADRRDSIEKVISSSPALQNMSPTDKWVIAGLMDRGMRHQNAPTTAEILEMAKANPEVMKALAAQQAQEAAQAQAGVPKIAASTGMAQAQAIPENRPGNIKELGAALRKGLLSR